MTPQGNLVSLEESGLDTHMALVGRTGGGKTNTITQLLDQRRRAYCELDGGGDGAEDNAALLEAHRNEIEPFVLEHTYYLDLTPEHSFCIDPGDPQGISKEEYHVWLRKIAEDYTKAIIRPHGEYNTREMPTLERVLLDTTLVCLVTGEDGRLGLGESLDFLNMGRTGWEEKFFPYMELIDKDIAQDILEIKYQSITQRRKEVLSSINRLRTFLSPLVKSVFSGKKPGLNFRQIVQNDGIIIANLRPTRFFTLEQSIAIGGVLMNGVIDACETTARENRKQFLLVMDEAEPYVGEDLALELARARKSRLSIWLGFQNLAIMED